MTMTSQRFTAGGLSLYRVGFLLRIAVPIVTVFLILLVAFTLPGEAQSLAVFALFPLGSLVAATVMGLSLLKLVRCGHAVFPRGLAMTALLVTAFVALFDVFTVGYFLVASLSSDGQIHTLGYFVVGSLSSDHGPDRDYASLAAQWPVAAILGSVTLLLVASALGRVGANLDDDTLVSRARWVQGLRVAASALALGCVLMVRGYDESTFDSKAWLSPLVVCATALGTLMVTIVAAFLHLVLVEETRRAMLARAGGG